MYLVPGQQSVLRLPGDLHKMDRHGSLHVTVIFVSWEAGAGGGVLMSCMAVVV